MPDYSSPSITAGASAVPLQADHDCVPSGIAWVDELLGGWRRDRLTALVTKGYRVSYWRLVEQIARRFAELGGEVDFIGSPLPQMQPPQPIDLDEIPKRPTTRWLIRRTIFENIAAVGAFVLLTPNPLFLIGAWAYGGRVPGECSRVTLTPTDNGWEKYVRRGKQEL